jgi:hypothetical protein
MKKLVNRILVDFTEEEMTEMESVTAVFNANVSVEQKADVRAERDQLLQATDWQALSDNTMGEAMTTYRQALRDVPDQGGFPFNVVWPEKP